MPIRPEDLRLRGLVKPTPVREEPEAPLTDLIYKLAEGIASAQTKLDLQTAEVLSVLAETDVEVVPQLTRRIDAEGTVTTESTEPEPRSLLELGFEPTRYQFSQATVEVGFDLTIAESEEREEETETESEYRLFARTYELREERSYQRDVESTAHITATLEPTPLPVRLSPAESIEGDEP